MNKKLLEQLRTYGLFAFTLIAAAMLLYFLLFRGAVIASGIAKVNYFMLIVSLVKLSGLSTFNKCSSFDAN